MNLIHRCCVFFALCTSIANGQNFESVVLLGQPIRAVVSDTNPPPFASFDESGRLISGVAKQLVDTLASDLRSSAEYHNVPRGRVLEWLIAGHADLACFLNPEWVQNHQAVDWSQPLFSSAQVIIRRRDQAAVLNAEALLGLRVGTIRGFVYPEFVQAFASGQIIRDDASSLQANLQRLAQGRVDAVLAVELSLGYTLKQHAQYVGLFAVDPLWTPAPHLFCAVSQSSPKRMQLLQQLARISADGRLAAMLAQYR